MLKKRYLISVLMLIVVALMLTGCKSKADKFDEDMDEYLTGTYYAALDVKEHGTIVLKLDADAAPRTVTNFVELVDSGFYDGLTFHRVVPGFMIQGGDPVGNGTGGSYNKIKGEFSENGFENPLSHTRGTISMARTKDYDNASCQFFIMQQDNTALDGLYAAFGHVIAGMDIVDLISLTPVLDEESGLVDTDNQPVIESARTITEYEAQKYIDEENRLPDPTATISFDAVTSLEGIETVDDWKISENGDLYLLSSSDELLSIALYEVDLSAGLEYDVTKPIAQYSYPDANEFISVQIIIPEGLSSLMITAEEHNGAIGKYILSYGGVDGDIYLVPVFE